MGVVVVMMHMMVYLTYCATFTVHPIDHIRVLHTILRLLWQPIPRRRLPFNILKLHGIIRYGSIDIESAIGFLLRRWQHHVELELFWSVVCWVAQFVGLIRTSLPAAFLFVQVGEAHMLLVA